MRLEIDEVQVAYGRTQVLFGVSLDVPHGSLTCLMGRNGVGKTTLLNAAMGLLPLRRGAVQRADGVIVTAYYYNDRKSPERYIAATLWMP